MKVHRKFLFLYYDPGIVNFRKRLRGQLLLASRLSFLPSHPQPLPGNNRKNISSNTFKYRNIVQYVLRPIDIALKFGLFY